tara:strand:+ start:542 stop:1477 length:936 start_codon:yes stop_codon:yes gene_type:complete
MKNIVIAIVALLLIGGGLYFFTQQVSYEKPEEVTPTVGQEVDEITEPTENEKTTIGVPATEEVTDETKTVIGTSAGGNEITAYHFGDGEEEILFIGGIHAGYSWNTVLLAYELIDYLDVPTNVPEGVKVTVIPTLNPDGQLATVGTTGQFTAAAAPKSTTDTVEGRFNGNGVDLNRNFDCQWQAEGVWQNKKVSGGTAAFSEPEAAALRDYVANNKPTAVVAYYAAAGGVYASTCNGAPSVDTTALMNTYAAASDYPAYKEFDFYEVTGDMVNWFAGQGVPAVSVLLSDRTGVEWAKNQKGIKAVLDSYAR